MLAMLQLPSPFQKTFRRCCRAKKDFELITKGIDSENCAPIKPDIFNINIGRILLAIRCAGLIALINYDRAIDIALGKVGEGDVLDEAAAHARPGKGLDARTILSVAHDDVHGGDILNEVIFARVLA
jgi:hypothetical protein